MISFRSLFAPVFSVMFLVAGVVLADAPKLPRPLLVVEPVRQAMQDRDYAAAVRAIDAAMLAADAPKDYLTYLKGRALMLHKEHAAAVGVFENVQQQFPDSVWARRARFAVGAALAASGKFDRAGPVYRTEAGSLFSIERKQEMAEIYLEYAEALFEPADEAGQPDYAKARTFYQQALDMGLKPQRQAEVELQLARCQQELKQYGTASNTLSHLIVNHPDNPLVIEARYRLGQCRLTEGQLTLARWAWQDLLKTHADAKSKWVAEAMFYLSRTWNMPSPKTDGQLELGVAALERFLDRYGDHKLASEAHVDIARSYAHRGRHKDAVERLVKFLADERFAEAEEVPAARHLLGKSYEAQEKYAEAIAAWRAYLVKHPTHKDWSSVQRQVITAEALLAGQAFQAKRYDEARRLFAEFMAKYPLDKRQPHILYMLGKMYAEEEKWDDAIDAWRRLMSKYPKSEEAAKAGLAIARTMEEELGAFEDALEQCRKIDYGFGWSDAQQTIVRLNNKMMTVATERVFRSDEVPRVRLTTRNVEKVHARVYRIDLEAYFRKTHRIEGIENLDISLIAPNRTFEYEVPDYQTHKEFVNQVEVAPGADHSSGVTAVTVSNKQLGYEATTLLIRSDLDIVAKSSREQLFVFAQNMRTGRPWPGVRLLLSNGEQVLAEATTGKDGVFQAVYEDLPALLELQRTGGKHVPKDVRIFAEANGHVASTRLALGDIEPASHLSDQGYIYTDRPAYCAGQTVHVRGCIRRAVADAFTIPAGIKLSLEVFDQRGRSLWQDDVTLGPFGTFHADFQLPVAAGAGKYRVTVRKENGGTYGYSFYVQPHAVDPVRLVIDVPRTVYYRGETIEGTIRAEHFYGTPLADREIQYELMGGRSHTVRTDTNGEAAFRVQTHDFEQPQTGELQVRLPQNGVLTTKKFQLATKGFAIQVRTQRGVFLAGEELEVAVVTRDASDAPVSRPLKLKVLALTKEDGNTNERLVGEHPLKTDAERGETRRKVTVDEGGAYALRVEGTDRFGNTISGERLLWISGDDDDVRLRILRDHRKYKVGETAEMTVHWRAEPALALVTMEGNRFLDYQLIDLKKGDNPLAIAVTERMVPEIGVCVTVMVDSRESEDRPSDENSRFHTASQSFDVTEDLNVQLAIRRQDGKTSPIRPGDEVEVMIETTDSTGKPVTAELSLDMIELSPRDRRLAEAAPIQSFFRRPGREFKELATQSSIVFQYDAYSPLEQAENGEPDDRLDDEIGQLESPGNDPPQEVYRGGFFSVLGPTHWNDDPFGRDSGSDSPDDDPFGGGAPAPDPFGSGKPDIVERIPEIVLRTATLQQLAAVPRSSTGYWNPAVVTGDDGKASVTFRLPDQNAKWLVRAGGVTRDTLVGRATDELTARKELSGNLRLPSAFTDGDEAEIIASVHNDLAKQERVEVVLKTTIAGQTVEQKRDVRIDGKSADELRFTIHVNRADKAANKTKQAAPSDDNVICELTVSAAGQTDVVRRAVPLRPNGMLLRAAASGAATQDTSVQVTPPGQTRLESPSLRIVVSPSVEESLVDLVLRGKPTWLPYAAADLHDDASTSSSVDTPLANVTSDLMAAVSLLGPLGIGSEQRGQVLQRIRAAISLLVAMQNGDGGFSFVGYDGPSSSLSTARAVWALSLARAAGRRVPKRTYDNAIQYLRQQMIDTPNTDYETTAILLHALSKAGQGDFAVANRLNRSRSSLSATALSYLALAFAEMDRKTTAAELVGVLKQRDLGHGNSTPQAALASLRWNQSPVELRALVALAIQAVAPRDDAVKKLVGQLMASRMGHRFTPDKATGPAAVALCRWYPQDRFESEPYKLAVTVNDKHVQTLELKPDGGTQVVHVPGAFLVEGGQQVQFKLNGRGRYSYECLLSGFVPTGKIAATTKAWQVERTYEPAPLDVAGREIRRGFDDTVRSQDRQFKNPLTQLAAGRRGLVDLKLSRSDLERGIPSGELEYLVATEPIPAGTVVLESSISGPFEYYEIGPGAITFYVGNSRSLGTIHYELLGHVPGSYRSLPTLVRNAFRPDEMAISTPAALTVLPAGGQTSDPYRMTPDELFALGKLYFDRGEFQQAGQYLTELTRDWELPQDVSREAIRLLLDVQLEVGQAAGVVQYFEIVKENWPDTKIPFNQVLAIGAAYQEMGEYERSYLVFRTAVEARFKQESSVAGFLQQQGKLLRAVNVMHDLLAEYPPQQYVAQATLGLAQTLYATSSAAETMPAVRDAKLSQEEIIRCAWQMFEAFLTDYPDDQSADRAAFAAATALLDLKDYAAAAAACNRYAKRYPKSELRDTFWYVMGYCHFAQSEHEAALEMCRKVAEYQRPDPVTGRLVEAKNKWQAVYILGQVYHSLGQPAKAIEQYRRVANRFADAQYSINYFTRKAIRLPEVTTVRPGEPVKLELVYRNVQACDMKVYRIDLMKFGRLRRNVRGAAGVHLAGVYPLHESTVELGDGRDFRDRTREVDLPLQNEGAYLIVARGDNLHTSGLVLITPLVLEVEEEAAIGRVQVTVKDQIDDSYVRDASIELSGGGGQSVVTGESDLRGVFVAEEVTGAVTVVARAPGDDRPDRYAFYRGRTILLPAQYFTGDTVRDPGQRFEQVESARIDPAGGSDAERRILAALHSPTRVSFVQTPLEDVVADLKRRHGIEIQIDVRALEDVGIGSDTPITRQLQGISLESALRLMLKELDLTYVIRDEVLLITTPEEAETQLITRAYPVEDLVRYRDEEERQWTDYDTVIDMITSAIAPTTWVDAGGSGSIDGLSLNDADLLVISQTREVLDEVEILLDKLRGLAPRKEGEPPPLSRALVGANPYSMGGGMGGLGGLGARTPQRPFVTSVVPVVDVPMGRGSADLLRGLKDTHRGFQDQQVDRLQRMYQGGGGMGGGMGAGGMF